VGCQRREDVDGVRENERRFMQVDGRLLTHGVDVGLPASLIGHDPVSLLLMPAAASFPASGG